MTQERLAAWFKGELPDEALTDQEVRWLEKQVFKAVARKLGALSPSKSLH